MASTPEGKAQSRLNAVKHGICATDEIFVQSLDGKDKQTFKKLRDSCYEQYTPASDHEKQLVDSIAIHIFRQMRVYKLENIAAAENTVLQHLDRLSRYDARVTKQIRALHNQLCFLHLRRGDSSLKLMTYN